MGIPTLHTPPSPRHVWLCRACQLLLASGGSGTRLSARQLPRGVGGMPLVPPWCLQQGEGMCGEGVAPGDLLGMGVTWKGGVAGAMEEWGASSPAAGTPQPQWVQGSSHAGPDPAPNWAGRGPVLPGRGAAALPTRQCGTRGAAAPLPVGTDMLWTWPQLGGPHSHCGRAAALPPPQQALLGGGSASRQPGLVRVREERANPSDESSEHSRKAPGSPHPPHTPAGLAHCGARDLALDILPRYSGCHSAPSC